MRGLGFRGSGLQDVWTHGIRRKGGGFQGLAVFGSFLPGLVNHPFLVRSKNQQLEAREASSSDSFLVLRSLGFPSSTLLPFFWGVPLLKPNSRKKGTLIIKGLLGNLVVLGFRV